MKFLALLVSILLPTLTILTAVEDIQFLFIVSLVLIPIWFIILVILANEETKSRL